MTEDRKICSFFVADLWLGVEVENVQEVIRDLHITPVPLASEQVRGLTNLRGQVIASIDLRRCLHLPDASPGEPPAHLILRTNDGPVSLLVDQMGAVLELGGCARGLSPGVLKGRLSEVVRDTYKLPNRLLLVLDTERLFRELAAAEPVGAASGGAR